VSAEPSLSTRSSLGNFGIGPMRGLGALSIV
jgi:hypothetical protein